MAQLSWPNVWERVALELNGMWRTGLEHLVTEDVVRFSTVRVLVDAGVPARNLEVEWRRKGVREAVDLVVTGDVWSAIEFKYPREPREKNAAWTQHLGEVLKDYYRLAHMPTNFDSRQCVQLMSGRMQRYLAGVNDRLGVHVAQRPGHVTELHSDDVQRLPATAHNLIAKWLADDAGPVRANCVASHAVGSDLHLVIHDVEIWGN